MSYFLGAPFVIGFNVHDIASASPELEKYCVCNLHSSLNNL